ncbi:ankyrin [Byssothecium circinans]|uniref:Ankyrin n=1 Tax=Byssothecium circinans TaxID=147558 RepID=A0A6A5T9Y2_9PLEO|nr:ankyrin [Byssothecium circinans]
MEEFDWVQSLAAFDYGTTSEAPTDTPLGPFQESTASAASRGSFASFVCHVKHLERRLRSFSDVVLDDSSNVTVSGKILGQGRTFMVRHAQWVQKPTEPPMDVALKEIISDLQDTGGTPSNMSNPIHKPQSDWKDILFEIRALLHEPIRYHPNLVRLLGIRWGLSPISESTYPVLIMEYAALGTFSALQASSVPLSSSIKQKLCYDVSRALSALHASAIVHGDMKHENVLIFPSKKAVEDLPYTAKLADFGGSVMDMTSEEFRKMETWTWPFQAPEISSNRPLTRSGMMLTDAYSFGLLVWRALMDGEGFVSLPGAAQDASDQAKRDLSTLKASESFTNAAVSAIKHYGARKGLTKRCVEMSCYVLLHTVRLNPEDRHLVKAQAALRGIRPGHISAYLDFVREKNEARDATEARGAPGRHGITRDSLAFTLGRYGNDADLQDNIPGFRPRLDEPSAEKFLFEPESLKHILTWDQQRQMLDEMKDAANRIVPSLRGVLDMKRTVAAFYVFQCYLVEFGTEFDAEEAIQWLLKASAGDDSYEDEDYLAQAFVWRLSRALDVDISIGPSKLVSLLRRSALRGHRTCLQDMLELAASDSAPGRQEWNSSYNQSRRLLQTQMGAVGMVCFFSSFLTAPWDTIDITNVSQLDNCIRAVIWSDYDACLRPQDDTRERDPLRRRGEDLERTAVDNIYVNRHGHGLLHWAAARGALDTLRHMIFKYKCNFDLPNQHLVETPLMCASQGGNLECARLLIDNGADPNGYPFGQESPLHWLCSFAPNEMETVAKRLLTAGANIEIRSGGMRHDVRGIRADWEHVFETRTTPLGRAVLMNDLVAVKTLLDLGANPLARTAKKHRGEWEGLEGSTKMLDVSSPFELSAVLCTPEILTLFIQHIDENNSTSKIKLLDEASMLTLAHEKTVVGFDPISLQSRLVRGGGKYKTNLRATLMLLYGRALPFNGVSPADELQVERSRVLCREVELGNLDVVECLLDLNYNSDGTADFRPLLKAVQLNHGAMFALLTHYKATANITQMTRTGNISLLHICASRPRQSRPGSSIAEALLEVGVAVESKDPRSKPPIALAILHQNFDVASALVKHGANVDATYPLTTPGLSGPEIKTATVLVEILSQHTMQTLESLNFLFGRRGGGPKQRPSFYVDPVNRLSILHQLAGSPHFTQIAQITPKILNLCLETYAETALINYKHPILGTALYHAASSGHKPMVERLLQYGAKITSDSGPYVEDSVHTLLRPKESYTPLWAALLRLDDALKKGALFPPAGSRNAWLKSNAIQNAKKIIELLAEDIHDSLSQQAITLLKSKRSSLEEQFRVAHEEELAERRNLRASDDEHPVDLGVLLGSRQSDEEKIREICAGPEVEWQTEHISQFFEELSL